MYCFSLALRRIPRRKQRQNPDRKIAQKEKSANITGNNPGTGIHYHEGKRQTRPENVNKRYFGWNKSLQIWWRRGWIRGRGCNYNECFLFATI